MIHDGEFVDPAKVRRASGGLGDPCPEPGCGAKAWRRCDSRGLHAVRVARHLRRKPSARVGTWMRIDARAQVAAGLIASRPGITSREIYESLGWNPSVGFSALRRARELGLARHTTLGASRPAPRRLASRRSGSNPTGRPFQWWPSEVPSA